MNIDAFIAKNDETLKYECTYYHDPNRWKEAPSEAKIILNSGPWSEYIKYLNSDGTLSDELDKLPNDQGGIYLFFIQGQTLPDSEMYLAYIGRAQYTNSQNIRKRVRSYLPESDRDNARPKICRLFKHWKDYLFVKYFPMQDNDLIKMGEATLIRAILPPFNDEIPNSIEFKDPQKAF